jgi:hypothetical protein
MRMPILCIESACFNESFGTNVRFASATLMIWSQLRIAARDSPFSITPDLYLALPLEKKIFRLGPIITATAIAETIGNILAAQASRQSSKRPVEFIP